VVLKKEAGATYSVRAGGAERRSIDGETCVLYCRNTLLVRGRDVIEKSGIKIDRTEWHGG
jgi:hypothetical protein